MNLKNGLPPITYPIIKGVTAVALFICIYLALTTIQEHVIFYQEQHSLFLWSRAYVADTMHSHGLMGLIAAFMVQFYHIPWLGAGIVALMMTGVYLMVEAIIRRLTGLRDFLQLGVVAAVGLYYTLDGIDESPAWVAVVFVGCLFFWLMSLLQSHFHRKCGLTEDTTRPETKCLPKMRVWEAIVMVVMPVVYIYGGLMLEMKGYDRPERSMILAEKAIKEHDWDGARDITERYLDTGRSNRLMLYFRNIALAEKGMLVDSIFNYPQKYGMQALAFPWRSDSRESEYGHLAHEVTGDINAAHHWAFEAMTVWGETAPHLLDLARYNVALGRPKVAEKFASKLDQSLFYRDEAAKIRRQIRGEEKSDLRYAVPDSLKVKWVNVLDFRPNVIQNHNADPADNVTRQYMIASLLLTGNLNALIPMLKPEDLKSRNIQEAILIYSLDPQSTPLSEFDLEIDPKVGDSFSHFYHRLKRDVGPAMEEDWGKSFWYYLHVIKPQVNEK